MLTDIFAERYATTPIWREFGDKESRLLVQAFRIVSEQLCRYFGEDGKEDPVAKAQWKSMHDRLSMELGLHQLSPLGYWAKTTLAGNPHQYWQTLGWNYVCQNFVCSPFDGGTHPDKFVKERLSFIEIAFRDKEQQIAFANAALPEAIAKVKARDSLPAPRGVIRGPGDYSTFLQASNDKLNASFKDSVNELNERLRRAGVKLNYHNGFIQIAEDGLIEAQVETPFWSLLRDPKWENVDRDMKEAIDLRDSGGRDPAWYAARALESTIKIISNTKGWTHGGEKGPKNWVDNLVGARNGKFITQWEHDSLCGFFQSVRNPLGHGPGDGPMPELTPQQTSWAIEFCMSWTKSLILRM